MRIEGKFCRGINVIWVVQSPSQKYSGSLLTQITSISFASRPNTEGRFAIVTNVGHGMRWTQAALLTRALCLRTAKSCGPDDSMVGVKSAELSAGDGDKQARSPGRARRKPLKPLRAGMPGDPGATVVTNARAYYSTRAAAGATGTRHSPLPLGVAPRPLIGAEHTCTTRAHCAAGRRRHICRHCEERSDEAIHTAAKKEWIASRSLSSGAHSRDPLARNDDLLFVIACESG